MNKNKNNDCSKCFVPIPGNSRCHTSDGGAWCKNLIIETIADTSPKTYRYVCSKGYVNHVSNIKLHSAT